MTEAAPPVSITYAPSGSGAPPREYALLEALCREDVAEAERLLGREPLRWGYVQALADYHGILPLVYARLRPLGHAVPADVLEPLRAQVNAKAAYSLFLTQDLGRLALRFHEAGFPFLAIKGAPLALRVYRSLALRPFVDSDLVVPRRVFWQVDRVLLEDGYTHRRLRPLQKRLFVQLHRQLAYWREVQVGESSHMATVDVHAGLMPTGYVYRERFEDLLARAERLVVGGTEVPTPSLEDLALLLAYHGFKNRWDRLKYALDVAQTLRAEPGIDWDALLRHAAASGGRRVLLLALHVVEATCRLDLPPEVARRVHADRRVAAVASGVLERLPRQAHLTAEPLRERMRLNLLAQDGPPGWLRYGAYAVARRVSNVVVPAWDD